MENQRIISYLRMIRKHSDMIEELERLIQQETATCEHENESTVSEDVKYKITKCKKCFSTKYELVR